jgi:hypothetical protein
MSLDIYLRLHGGWEKDGEEIRPMPLYLGMRHVHAPFARWARAQFAYE